MKRRRKGRETERTESPLRMVEQKLRDPLDGETVARADRPEKLHRARVAGDKDVLPVVDDRPRGFVDKGIGTPSGGLPLLEDQDRDTARGEVNGGGKAAEASTDDYNGVHSV